jgi:cell division transport system ATP-binding protein
MFLSFDHVSLQYGPDRPALADVSFQMPPGAFFFLTGPSGAGKSSLLRLIYGGEKPSAGTIFLFGRDIAGLDRKEWTACRRQIGIVFQEFRLIPYLSALENVALPLRLAGVAADYTLRHATELLEWVGLKTRLEAKPPELSGGEQQRVAIARAVVNRPKLLLADEPTGNIDDETALKLLHLFIELNKMGTAVILATHQHHLVGRFGKTALHLKGGVLSIPTIKAA